MTITPEEIERRFGYHRATFPVDYDPQANVSTLSSLIYKADANGDIATAPLHARVRQLFIAMAEELVALVPADSAREGALMLTALQEASHWANTAIAMQAPIVQEW